MLGRVQTRIQSPDSAYHGTEMTGEVTQSVSRLFSFPGYLEFFVCGCKVEAKNQPSPAAPDCSLALHCMSMNCPIYWVGQFHCCLPFRVPSCLPTKLGEGAAWADCGCCEQWLAQTTCCEPQNQGMQQLCWCDPILWKKRRGDKENRKKCPWKDKQNRRASYS